MNLAQFWVSSAFLFAVGAAVGSFVNVLVFRLPRGLSLLRPGSRCPRCLASIAPRDNLPVLGWLVLAGRCRSCQAPIPARYPLVEAAGGVLAASLPAIAALFGRDLTDLSPAILVASTLAWVVLTATALTAVLLRFDRGHRHRLRADPASRLIPAAILGRIESGEC